MQPTLTPTESANMARPAGVLYLIIIAFGLVSEIVVRSALHVPGDAAATASNILADVGLFRASIAADAVMVSADIALALLLYFLLRPAGPLLAALAAAFRLSQSAVIAGNILNQQSALMWLLSPGLTPETTQALAYQALELHAFGYDLGLVFFGVNSVLTGILLIRSLLFPRWIGQLLVGAGAVYLAGSTLRILAPALSDAFAPAYLLAVIAETALAIGLLRLGATSAARRRAHA